MYNESIYNFILTHLKGLLCQNQLEQSVSSEMLPALAEALAPIVRQYMQQKACPSGKVCFPEPMLFNRMVYHFNQDAARVRTLLKSRELDEDFYWQRLHKQLQGAARRRWPTINMIYQEEIAQRTWLRIHRYLPSFLFMSSFSTWVNRILLNEYLRLKAKIEKEKLQCSIDSSYEAAIEGENYRTLADFLPSAEAKPAEKVERLQTLELFWQRMAQLGQALDLKILRLHLAGYKLEEIKKELGGSPGVSTIWKRRKRIIQRIKEDEIMQEIAQELGI